MPRYSSRVPSRTLFRGRERGRLISLVLLSLIVLGIINKARDPSTYDFLAKPEVARVHLGPDGLPMDDSPRRRAKPNASAQTGASGLLAQNSGSAAKFDATPQSGVGAAAQPSADVESASSAHKSAIAVQASEAPVVVKSEPTTTAESAISSSGATEQLPAAEKPSAEKPSADAAPKPSQAAEAGEQTFPDDLPPSETSLNEPSVGSKEIIRPALSTTPGTEIQLKDYHPVGPTDEDPDEWDTAKSEDFFGVEDSVLVGNVDMPTYRRLHQWVSRQTLEQLRARSQKKLSHKQYMLSPEPQRGQLVHLNLEVRRCVVHTNGKKQFGVEKYYEYWGYSKDDGNHPYCVVTMYPPEGMPSTGTFQEQIGFDGYFFKLLAYSAEAKPNASRVAPMFVGRFDIKPPVVSEPAENMGDYLWWGVGGMALFCCLVIGGFMLAPRRRGRMLQETSHALGDAGEAVDLDTWLDQAENGELSADGNNSESSDDSNDEQYTNGHADSGQHYSNGHNADPNRGDEPDVNGRAKPFPE